MNAERWEATIPYTAETHGLSILDAGRMYRPELLTPALGHSRAGPAVI